jgi:hypothetical protein
VGFFLTIVLFAGTIWTLWRSPTLVRGSTGARSPTLLAHAILFAVAGGYLTYYAASEDSYRRGGISRWEAYDAYALTGVAIAACFAVSVLAVLADRRRNRVVWLTAPAGLAAAILFAVAFAANSLN